MTILSWQTERSSSNENHMLADEFSGIRSYHVNVTEQLLRLVFKAANFQDSKLTKHS